MPKPASLDDSKTINCDKQLFNSAQISCDKLALTTSNRIPNLNIHLKKEKHKTIITRESHIVTTTMRV